MVGRGGRIVVVTSWTVLGCIPCAVVTGTLRH